jgi:Pentapeptide repeats (9 copies)
MTALDPTDPFPGPKPYTKAEHDFFRGREADTLEVWDRTLRERISVLAGPSGAGKTSLLQAGVEYFLDGTRRESKMVTSKYKIGPVLVLRGWQGAPTVADTFCTALRTAVANMSDPFVSRRSALKALDETASGDFAAQVSALCDLGGGAVIVLDQLEEILRRGDPAANEAVQLITSVHEGERRVHMLLSLREEQVGKLHKLEAVSKGLLGRTIFLKPMSPAAASLAFKEAMGVNEIWIEASVVQHVLKWTQTSNCEIDLLSANAIFRDLHQFFRAGPSETDEWVLPAVHPVSGHPVLDISVVDAFERRRAAGGVREVVLWKWIENSFEAPQVDAKSDRPNPGRRSLKLSRIAAAELSKYVAVRMAPHLSSGGYKTQLEQVDLFMKALRPELDSLRVDAEAVIRVLGSRRGTHLDASIAKQLAAAGVPAQFDKTAVSGLALSNEWSPAHVTFLLILAAEDALARLETRAVLKKVGAGDVDFWELGHDGLAGPLAAWAAASKGTLDDILRTIVARRGEGIVVRREVGDQSIEAANWQGCWIGPLPDLRAAFTGSTISGCNFQGALFAHCDFESVRFVDSCLDGTVFLDCNFQKDVQFESCSAEGLTFRNCTMGGVRFWAPASAPVQVDRPWLNHLGLRQVVLTGPVSFDGIDVSAAAFTELLPSQGCADALVDLREARVSFSWWDPQSAKLLRFGAERRNCGPNKEYARRPEARSARRSVRARWAASEKGAPE